MTTKKLTKKLINSLEPKPVHSDRDERYIVWDDVSKGGISGFGIIVHPVSPLSARGKRATGRKKFFIKFRENGRIRKIGLGDFGVFTVDQARDMAREILAENILGKAPAAKRDADKDSLTIDEMVSEYLEKHCITKKSYKHDLAYVKNDVLPAWGGRRADLITKKDVIALIDKKSKTAPRNAQRLRVFIVANFRWAMRRDMISEHPCEDLPKPPKFIPSDRYLEDNELRIFFKKLPSAKIPENSKLALRMLLLTGARSSEVLGITAEEIDFEQAVWHLPGERSKNGLPLLLPLTNTAINVLKEARKKAGGEFFFSKSKGKVSAGTLGDNVRYNRKHFGIKEWTPKALRKTASTHMAKLGVRETIVERVTNHKIGGVSQVAGVYNLHDYVKEKREALEVLEAHLLKLEKEEPLAAAGAIKHD
ncbi:MAG: tyrosine-type recombinase/integrase [Proteobacteria bacterium]|nr:tyrosine-type recombinase/integrase [Pseudomonadota bacterium]